MNKEIDDIIKNKNYHDLSGDDLRLLEKNGISKHEFINLKLFFQQLEIEKQENIESLEGVKGKLDELFEKKHSKKGGVLWKSNKSFFYQPLVQVAALVVLIFLVFRMTNFENEKQMAQVSPAETDVLKEKALQESVIEKPSVKNKEVDLKQDNALVEKEDNIEAEPFSYNEEGVDEIETSLLKEEVSPQPSSSSAPEIIGKEFNMESLSDQSYVVEQDFANVQYSSQSLNNVNATKSDLRLTTDLMEVNNKNEELALITPLF